jgi:hypothetical protein
LFLNKETGLDVIPYLATRQSIEFAQTRGGILLEGGISYDHISASTGIPLAQSCFVFVRTIRLVVFSGHGPGWELLAG